MSEKQQIILNRRRKDAAAWVCPTGSVFFHDLCITIALILVVIVLAVNLSTPIPEPDIHDDTPFPQETDPPTPAVFDADAYYRTIIDNNLFRPLGWTRRVPVPAYRLTGTIIRRNGETPPQALILATGDHKTHIVIAGDKLAADTIVIEIRSKHVILESGSQRITLKLDTSAWLHTSRGHFSRPR